jgi:ceramide glucosyltransferase
MLLTFPHILLAIAAIPSIYYLLALYSTWRFFADAKQAPPPSNFTPPISNLKPIRGLDPDAYENFASFCRQDYPDYEIVFCVDNQQDPVLPVIEKLKREFPERSIRVLFGSGRNAVNDKVAKLARLSGEARHEFLVVSDSDVRVQPDYLRSVIAPLADPAVGAVTCPYVPTEDKGFIEHLQSVGMFSDFYAGLFVARELDGVKFALGPTIATTRARLAEFGGYASIENRPADDLLVGRMIAEHGHRIELLPYAVGTVPDYRSLQDLFLKRLRWIVVMRHMRPWGHLGLLLTQGLPWSLVAIALNPTLGVAISYLGVYLALRIAMTWMIGIRGLKQDALKKDLVLIPLWDAFAFLIWLISFTRRSVRWRGSNYYIRQGLLVPVAPVSNRTPD